MQYIHYNARNYQWYKYIQLSKYMCKSPIKIKMAKGATFDTDAIYIGPGIAIRKSKN